MGMHIEWVEANPNGSNPIGPGEELGGYEELTDNEINLFVGDSDGAVIQGSYENVLAWLDATRAKVVAFQSGQHKHVGWTVRRTDRQGRTDTWLTDDEDEWTPEYQEARLIASQHEASLIANRHGPSDYWLTAEPAYRHDVDETLTSEPCAGEDECSDCLDTIERRMASEDRQPCGLD